ncbi:lipoprotein NosL [Halovivax asiaticus JCM 14624]|uniref:Lipoprotein NosL n=1 Tax=Halovivax asiaticus JCM 14624 TaxID=1227490 RepID=M0BIS1_9EURY|nr:nitrous oxide reductase accessory protein NosL [Halovivax asiaticus]ELZ10760.1 lipoprotein NosL [Halovivax asiaticus JCM 14624]
MCPRDSPSSDNDLHRRAVLAGTAVVGFSALAGCLDSSDGDADAPDPIAIDPDHACDNCTMRIGNFGGSAGQSFYDDPEAVLGPDDDTDRPAQFCSARCTYTFTFDHEAEAEPVVSYLTDYSAVDWSVDTGGDAPTMSRHLDADAFAPAADLTLVVDSDVGGAMGGSLFGFSTADDAESFQAEYDGELYDHEDVSPTLIQSLMG